MPLYNLGFDSNKIFDDKMIYAKGMSVLYFKFFKDFSTFKSKSLIHRHMAWEKMRSVF